MDYEIIFESSRSGEMTCSFKGKYLHSKYNPLVEGERFAQTVEADFSPLCLFILEPALSYCADAIKKKFPNALICAIRFSSAFVKSDSQWHKVFYLDQANFSIPLSEILFETLGEEKLISSLAFSWPPSQNAFPEQTVRCWEEIKKAILKARDVMGTRAYFSERWLKNSLIFASNIKRPVIAEKGNLPLIIAASGPSLLSSLPFLKKYRDYFFLIAVSSALMPLQKNGIRADMVISSDGGYWAKRHIDFSGQDSTIFALEAESAVPKKIFENNKIIPLVYDDGLEKDFLDAIGCPYMLSERNGTVAGTALCFAHTLTDGNIYLCGLDQAPSPAFQHTQPNALENGNSKNDSRLRNCETRITKSRFSSEKSLEIYRNWFITNSAYFSKRVSRLSDNFKYDFPLGNISEKNWDDFEKTELVKKKNDCTKKISFSGEKNIITKGKRKKILEESLLQLSKSSKFIEEVFPMDAILIKRELSGDKKKILEEKLHEKIALLLKKCGRLIRG